MLPSSLGFYSSLETAMYVALYVLDIQVPGSSKMLTKCLPISSGWAFLHSLCNQSYQSVLPQYHCRDCWTVSMPNSCTLPIAYFTFCISPDGLYQAQFFKDGKYLGMNPILMQTKKWIAKGYTLTEVLQKLKASMAVKTLFSQRLLMNHINHIYKREHLYNIYSPLHFANLRSKDNILHRPKLWLLKTR